MNYHIKNAIKNAPKNARLREKYKAHAEEWGMRNLSTLKAAETRFSTIEGLAKSVQYHYALLELSTADLYWHLITTVGLFSSNVKTKEEVNFDLVRDCLHKGLERAERELMKARLQPIKFWTLQAGPKEKRPLQAKGDDISLESRSKACDLLVK